MRWGNIAAHSLTFALDDTGTVGIVGAGSIVNTGTTTAPWSIAPIVGIAISPSSGSLAAGATQVLTITLSIAGTYVVDLVSAGATIAGNPQTIIAAPAVAPSLTWTAPSPAAGVVGVASGNFTATLLNGVSSVVVTPASTLAGTWTPTTRTLTVGSPTSTFTFTPSASGAHSASLGNNALITPPAAVGYAASAAATAFTLAGSTSGITGIATTFTVTPNAPLSAACTVSITAAGATLSTASLSFASGAIAAQTFTVTRATDGTTSVSITNSLGLTNTGSPISYATSASTVASLLVYPSTTGTSLPYSATVLPLEGALPAGYEFSSPDDATIRTSVLSTWSDGSAAVAIVTGAASAVAGTPSTVRLLAVAAGSSTPLTSSAISALVSSVSVAFGSPYGTASIISFSTPERIWWANAHTICARYRVAAPTPGTTALEAVIDIHAWAGRALVEVTVENGKMTTATPTKPTAASYTGATVSINGGAAIATVNASGAPEGNHAAFRSWYAIGWIGGDPGLRVTQAVAELQRHPLLWKMDQSNSTFDMTGYASDAYTPWGNGRHPASGMGGTGDADFIGPLPKWEARFLQSGDYRAARATEVAALAVLGFNVNYRDSTTGLVPTFAELTGKTQQGGVWPSQSNGGDQMMWEVAHHPAAGLMAFICRPSPVFIEIAQKVAVWNGTWSTARNGGPTITTGVFGQTYQGRGRAWCLRSLAHAVFLTPDALPWKAAGKTSISDNVTWMQGFSGAAALTLNCSIEQAWYDPQSGQTGANRFVHPVWFHHYQVTELHKVASARLLTGSAQTALNALADWFALQPVRWVNEQSGTGDSTIDGGWRYIPYELSIGKNITTVDSETTWGAQMKWWYQTGATLNGGGPFASSPSGASGAISSSVVAVPNTYADFSTESAAGGYYPSYWWAALQAAYERGVSGSGLAMATVVQNASNLATWRQGFQADPRWGAFARNYVPAGFGTDSNAGTYNAGTFTWTPGRDGAGLVNAASWALVPTGTWVRIAGTRLDALDAPVKAALLPASWGDISGTWHALIIESWGGFCVDYASGARMWWAGGGHGASANNGLYGFSAFKMSWYIEALPTVLSGNGADWTNGIAGSGGLVTIQNATLAKYDATTLQLQNDTYGDEVQDGKPWARHWYRSMVYAPEINRIIGTHRRLWSYSLGSAPMTGSWDYKCLAQGVMPLRTRVVQIQSNLDPSEGVAQVGRSACMDPEHGQGMWDSVAGEYLISSYGSSGIPDSGRLKWSDKIWAAWSAPTINGDGADCMVGDLVVQLTAGAATNSQNGPQIPRYTVYNPRTRTATHSAVSVQFGDTTTVDEFYTSNSSNTYDGPSLVYDPVANRYYFWTLMQANAMQAFEVNPTTTPWTLTKKTFTGAAPNPHKIMGRKMMLLTAANAIVFFNDGSTDAYLYKLR